MIRHPSSIRGFSLVELLMAIFILGIGIISIATLFPAGISQQRKAMDDQVGPLVARNAMSLLRTRVPVDAFGYVEFMDMDGDGLADGSPWDIRSGDWPWLRPSVVTETSSSGPGLGSIDIFDSLDYYDSSIETSGEKDSDDPWLTFALTPAIGGIPYYGHGNGLQPPVAVIEQAERQYPRYDGSGRAPRYYWDCMFRRSGGKLYAAIFVYRVKSFQGDQSTWTLQPDDQGMLQVPWMLDLEDPENDYSPWRVGQGQGDMEYKEQWLLENTDVGDSFVPEENDDCWQCPGQWLVDQNGIINRISVGRTRRDDPTTHAELERPVAPLAEDSLHVAENSPEYGYTSDNRVPSSGSLILPGGARNDPWFSYHAGMIVPPMGVPETVVGGPIVSRIWYLPNGVENDQGDSWALTPIYILVEEF